MVRPDRWQAPKKGYTPKPNQPKMTEQDSITPSSPKSFELWYEEYLKRTKWGDWEFCDNLTLLYRGYYDIDLERINSNSEMLDCIFQCSAKDQEHLIIAFQRIFNPQKNCCSSGRNLAFSGSKLAKEFLRQVKPKRQNISPKLRYSILERDGFCCKACGATPNQGATLHVDHIHPVSKGGSNDPDNLQTLCAACNLGKGARV